MLNDTAILNLINPLLEQQKTIEQYILLLIAKRLREIGNLAPSDTYKIAQSFRTGEDIRKIQEEISKRTNKISALIRLTIRDALGDSYSEVNKYFRSVDKKPIPFTKNDKMLFILDFLGDDTITKYRNTMNNLSFTIPDTANALIKRNVSPVDSYQNILQEALQIKRMPSINYTRFVRKKLRNLIDSGLRTTNIDTETGKTSSQPMISALRTLMVGVIKSANQQVQEEMGEQIGADGVELSAHANSAPDHEPVQGRFFTNEEFEKLQSYAPFQDVNGIQYEPIRRPIGAWNCTHLVYKVVLKDAKPHYSEAQLRRMAAENNRGITLPNGKHLTLYECTQQQRAYENQIRKYRLGQLVARESGDIEEAERYRAKEVELWNRYKDFSDACGLKTQPLRIL